jgi:hypothetical protein
MSYIHTKEYYLTIRMNGLQLNVIIRMTLTDIMLSRGKQTQKNTYQVILFIKGIKAIETKSC